MQAWLKSDDYQRSIYVCCTYMDYLCLRNAVKHYYNYFLFFLHLFAYVRFLTDHFKVLVCSFAWRNRHLVSTCAEVSHLRQSFGCQYGYDEIRVSSFFFEHTFWSEETGDMSGGGQQWVSRASPRSAGVQRARDGHGSAYSVADSWFDPTQSLFQPRRFASTLFKFSSGTHLGIWNEWYL